MAISLKGAPVAKSLDEVSLRMADLLLSKGISPSLAMIRVGENADDIAYENAAVKRCAKLGIKIKKLVFPASVETCELLRAVDSVNKDPNIHGCLIFLPLPKTVDEAAVKNAISPAKDIDGVSAGSLAGIFAGNDDAFLPCTARACIETLDYYGCDIEGSRAAVIGRSLVIGKPVAMALLKRNATVTICHTRTKDLKSEIAEADIVVAAAGSRGVVDSAEFAEDTWALDVGINVDDDGYIHGDIACDDISEALCYGITPVPGGVGNVTTAVLARHTLEAALAQNGIIFVDF